MSAPGAVWMPGGQVISPSWLYSRFVARYGADLLGFWIGADQPASGSISSLTGRVGGNIAGTAVYQAGSAINGRRAWSADGSTTGTMVRNVGTTIKTTVTVLTSPSLPFSTGYAAAVSLGATDLGSHCQMTVGASGTSVLFLDGPTAYIDGTASSTVTSGTHVYHATESASASSTIRVGYTGSGWSWRAAQGLIVAIARVASADDIASDVRDCRRYFKL